MDQIIEPMIADPDVHNDDLSKRAYDTIRPIFMKEQRMLTSVLLVMYGTRRRHEELSLKCRNIRKDGTVEFKHHSLLLLQPIIS